MKALHFLALTALAATPAVAEDSRQLDAHVHGVGKMNIAVDGDQIAMELHVPGADIVGFEYAAESAEDLAAIEGAIAVLSRPLDLFVLPTSAGCSVVEAAAVLEGDADHDGHDHGDAHADDHAGHDHGHEDHAEHGHDDHADAGHKDHGHEEHAHDHGHDHGHDHSDEAAAGHTEFHAEYLLTCTDATAVTEMTFAYFETFPNALEVEVQLLSDAGATAFEVKRDAPTLDLGGLF